VTSSLRPTPRFFCPRFPYWMGVIESTLICAVIFLFSGLSPWVFLAQRTPTLTLFFLGKPSKKTRHSWRVFLFSFLLLPTDPYLAEVLFFLNGKTRSPSFNHLFSCPGPLLPYPSPFLEKTQKNFAPLPFNPGRNFCPPPPLFEVTTPAHARFTTIVVLAGLLYISLNPPPF